MVSASACVGFTLPGMIELPGSFSGMRELAEPERGPEASKRMSLAILKSAAARVFSAPCANTQRLVAGKRGELVRRRHERKAGRARDCARRPGARTPDAR